jgi:hypothetical protein
MKLPVVFAISMTSNLVLATVLWLPRLGSPAAMNVPLPSAPGPAIHSAGTTVPAAVVQGPALTLPWRAIESDDYRQYIANLRAAGCPQWLIRDIFVGDIDHLYQQKHRTDPVDFEPWLSEDQRREVARGQSAKNLALRQEKRAVVKTLLGYEWDNHADEIWNWDLLTSLTLGFLPDDKAAQVLFRQGQATDDAQAGRGAANFILIAADRARLQSIYVGLQTDLAQLLDSPAFDELQLRGQQPFLVDQDLHFEGVSITSGELRELVRASKSVKDIARNEFVSARPLSEADQTARAAGFAAQVEKLLGAERFADYQRAQDADFRETFAFSQQNNLPKTAAIAVYDFRRTASGQADEIRQDGSLSADERTTALEVLKAATLNNVSAALGASFQNYLAGPGQWLATLVPPPTPVQTP